MDGHYPGRPPFSPVSLVILHFSYLSPQYLLKRLVCVQLCISGIPTLACLFEWFVFFSLTVSKRRSTEVFLATS